MRAGNVILEMFGIGSGQLVKILQLKPGEVFIRICLIYARCH